MKDDADELLSELRSNASLRKQAADRLISLEADLDEQQLAAGETTAELEKWADEWKKAMQELGQASSQRPQDIEGVLTLYDSLETIIRDRNAQETRLHGIQKDEKQFEKDVSKLAKTLALGGKGDDVVAVGHLLFERLQEMLRAQEQLKTLQSDLSEYRVERSDNEAELAETEGFLVSLREEANCANDDDLAAVHARWSSKQEIEETLHESLENLRGIGDGLDIKTLADEADKSTPDEDRAAVQVAEERLATIQESFADIGSQSRDLDHKRHQITQGRGADQAAQIVERSIADLRDISQSYIVGKAASLLLQSAIDKIRQDREGPILAAAGKLFSDLTDGSFMGLATDYDDNDRPVLKGERPDKRRVGVDGLSEGARDQLFLALRLAQVREYLDKAEPLPFVADDLLMAFDDDRAGTAIRVLADLSATTQVFFFTHHAHLVELVKQHLGKDTFALHSF